MLFILFLQAVLGDRPILTTQYGRIRGVEMTTLKGRSISAFMSVPYASPPSGRRFEEMKGPRPWAGVRDCGTPSPSCLYLNKKREIVGEEDCLFLNVYTPVKDFGSFNELLPVVVYIHGGAYHSFSGSMFGPRYLLDKNVLLVTLNFRLGVLGFLSSGDHVLPGNLGLKDQVLALKWIRGNIRHFGGDPGSVTLFGMSSGASMILLHYFSPMSRNLFHRGFASGGSPLSPWSFQKNPRERLLSVAEHFRCPRNSTFDVVFCLERIPAERLAASLQVLQRGLFPMTPVGPVVDSTSSSPFLNEYPYESLFSTRMYNVPLVMSDAYNSGAVPFAYKMDSHSILSLLNDQWTSQGPVFLDFVDSMSVEYREYALQKVKQAYFGTARANYSNLPSFLKMLSDRQYLSGAIKTAVLAARLAQVYLFIFNYRGYKSTSESYGSPVFTYGASHVDDTFYILNVSSDVSLEKTPKDLLMIDKMVEMIASFSKTGVASFGQNVSWPPLRRHLTAYGEIPFLQVDGPEEFKWIRRRNVGNNELWDLLPLNEPWAGRIA